MYSTNGVSHRLEAVALVDRLDLLHHPLDGADILRPAIGEAARQFRARACSASSGRPWSRTAGLRRQKCERRPIDPRAGAGLLDHGAAGNNRADAARLGRPQRLRPSNGVSFSSKRSMPSRQRTLIATIGVPSGIFPRAKEPTPHVAAGEMMDDVLVELVVTAGRPSPDTSENFSAKHELKEEAPSWSRSSSCTGDDGGEVRLHRVAHRAAMAPARVGLQFRHVGSLHFATVRSAVERKRQRQ